MTLRQSLRKHSYKTVFNIIFKNFLQDKSCTEVYSLDLNFLAAWNSLVNTESYDNYKNCSIYLVEIEDDLEDPPEQIVDVCLIDSAEDALQALDFLSWGEIIDLDIKNSTNLSDKECLAYILWEITFWGFSDSSIAEQKAKLKKSRKDWQQVEKELKDLYNPRDESL